MSTTALCQRTAREKSTYKHRVRESRVERYYTLEILDLVCRQCDLEGVNVRLKMLNLAAANDREDVRRLLHDICDGD